MFSSKFGFSTKFFQSTYDTTTACDGGRSSHCSTVTLSMHIYGSVNDIEDSFIDDCFFNESSEMTHNDDTRDYRTNVLHACKALAMIFSNRDQSPLVSDTVRRLSEVDKSEIKFLAQLAFITAEDIDAFVEVVAGLSPLSDLFYHLADMNLVQSLAKAEVSEARLSTLLSNASIRLMTVVWSAIVNEFQLILSCPVSWKSACYSILEADKKDVVNAFLDGLGSGYESRFMRYLYVWTQGNEHILRQANSLVGTDTGDILDAVLALDGVKDYPAYTLIGMYSLFSQWLATSLSSSAQSLAREENMIETASRRVCCFCHLIRRIFEKISEIVEGNCEDLLKLPTVVEIHLNSIFIEKIINFNYSSEICNSKIQLFQTSPVTGHGSVTISKFDFSPSHLVNG